MHKYLFLRQFYRKVFLVSLNADKIPNEAKQLSFKLQASCQLEHGTNRYKYLCAGQTEIFLDFVAKRELKINDGLTSITWENGQASQPKKLPTFTATLGGTSDFTASSIEWSVSQNAYEKGMRISNGQLYWESLTTCSISFTVSLSVVEANTSYKYSATSSEISLTVGAAKDLTITNDGSVDLAQTIVNEYGQTIKPTTTNLLLKLNGQAPTIKEQNWAFDVSTPAIDGLSLDQTTGKLDWTNVTTTNGVKTFKINVHMIEDVTFYEYSKSITISLNIASKRNLSIGGGVAKIEHQTGQTGWTCPTSFTAALTGVSSLSGILWSVTDANGNTISNLNMNTDGQLVWGNGLNFNGTAVIHANYTEPNTGYKYSATKNVTVSTMDAKIFELHAGAASRTIDYIKPSHNGSCGYVTVKLGGANVADNSKVSIIPESGSLPSTMSLSKEIIENNTCISINSNYSIPGTWNYKFHVTYSETGPSGQTWSYTSNSLTLTITCNKLNFTDTSGTTWNDVSTCCHAAEAGKYSGSTSSQRLESVMSNTDVGKTRTLNLRLGYNGSDANYQNVAHTVRIVDKNVENIANDTTSNPDSRYDGLNIRGKKACLTFLFDNVLTYKYGSNANTKMLVNWASGSTTSNSWNNSYAKSYLNVSNLRNFEDPNTIKIPALTLKTYNGLGTTTGAGVETSNDSYVWVPSLANFFSQSALDNPLFGSASFTSSSAYMTSGTAWADFANYKAYYKQEGSQFNWFTGVNGFTRFVGWAWNGSDGKSYGGSTIKLLCAQYVGQTGTTVCPYWMRGPYSYEVSGTSILDYNHAVFVWADAKTPDACAAGSGGYYRANKTKASHIRPAFSL